MGRAPRSPIAHVILPSQPRPSANQTDSPTTSSSDEKFPIRSRRLRLPVCYSGAGEATSRVSLPPPRTPCPRRRLVSFSAGEKPPCRRACPVSGGLALPPPNHAGFLPLPLTPPTAGLLGLIG
uniref:Uncharacterized protein n=1 Tax=Oryza meridionalis TaxID=40149 RepID=A0A0E0F2I5_9ORYZ